MTAIADEDINIYVDQLDGDDANPGTAERPVKTRERGMALRPDVWKKGCRVYLKYGLLTDEQLADLRAMRERGEV